MSKLWPELHGPCINYISQPPSQEWLDLDCKNLVILGSTGSIGCNALKVVNAHPQTFKIVGLAGGRNVELLARQALKHKPAYLATIDEKTAQELKGLLPQGYTPRILFGPEGYAALSGLAEADTILSAQSGSAGLEGSLAAALHGKVICLANKESLVLAGSLLRQLCEKTGATILPVDSEHNALFQCLAGRSHDVDRLVLTASGGPFLGKSAKELHDVSPRQALKHPNWSMGAKISIDSATMMNKGLEIIEAYHLFGTPIQNIQVLVHPQSVVHSLVRLKDASLIAQMGAADMRLPIAACLLWPECQASGVEQLDLIASSPLTFLEPDRETFPCPGLARQALQIGDAACVVLNAANEMCVELFLKNRCRFQDIPAFVEKAVQHLAAAKSSLPLMLQKNAMSPALAIGDEVSIIMGRIKKITDETCHFILDLALSGEKFC